MNQINQYFIHYIGLKFWGSDYFLILFLSYLQSELI